ncbi:MAG: DUF3303 family protein [Candidatus Ranarchaeia archaeon]
MIFVTICKVRPGKYEEALKVVKEFKDPPPEIKLIANYATFGRLDGIIILEAPDEATAWKFLVGFQEALQTETFLAIGTFEEIGKLAYERTR